FLISSHSDSPCKVRKQLPVPRKQQEKWERYTMEWNMTLLPQFYLFCHISCLPTSIMRAISSFTDCFCMILHYAFQLGPQQESCRRLGTCGGTINLGATCLNWVEKHTCRWQMPGVYQSPALITSNLHRSLYTRPERILRDKLEK